MGGGDEGDESDRRGKYRHSSTTSTEDDFEFISAPRRPSSTSTTGSFDDDCDYCEDISVSQVSHLSNISRSSSWVNVGDARASEGGLGVNERDGGYMTDDDETFVNAPDAEKNADAAPRMSAQQRQSSGPRMSSPTRGQRQSNFHFSTNRMSRPKSVDESAHHGAKTSPTKSEHGSRGTDVRVRLRASTGRPQSPNPFFPDYQESPRTERSVASRHRSEGYDGTEIYETRVQRGRMPERTSSRRGSYEHSASPPREWLPPSPRRGNDSKVLTDSPRGWEPHTSNPRELPDIERAPSFRAYSQAPTSRDDKQRGGYGSPSPPSLNDSSPGRQQASDEGSLFYPTFAPHHRHREPARTFVGRDLSEGWTIVQRQNTVRPLIQSPSPVAREEKPRSVWRPRQGMRIDNLREPGVVGLNHTLHKPPPRSQNSGVSNIGVSRSSSRGDTDGTASDFEREISDGPFLTMNEQRAQNMNQNPTAGSRGQNRRAPPRTFASRSPEESPLVISQVRNWPKKRTKRKTMEEVVRERMIDSPSMSLEISGCGRM